MTSPRPGSRRRSAVAQADTEDRCRARRCVRRRRCRGLLPTASSQPAVARAAHGACIHYFDLTEDVADHPRHHRAEPDGRSVMAPQCGLAPGFVGIVGAAQVAALRSMPLLRLRVGALPQNPTGLMGYAFNWSPEGVVNEYLNDCEVIEQGERKWVSVDGVARDALHRRRASGGVHHIRRARHDVRDYHGRVDNVDYKSMRYPGHMRLMNFFFHELLMRERRRSSPATF